jgi:hypothetical protein
VIPDDLATENVSRRQFQCGTVRGRTSQSSKEKCPSAAMNVTWSISNTIKRMGADTIAGKITEI